jgi:hypothetical protein
MSTILTHVGPLSSADGTLPILRGTRSGSMVAQQQSGKYAEAVMRGSCYVAAVPPGTGVAPPATLSTTAALSLCNPAGSGKRLRVMGVSIGYISGTLGAGVFILTGNTSASQAAPTSGTSITPTNLLITGGANASGLTRFGSTLPATPTMLEALANVGAFVGGAGSPPTPCYFDLDGRYVVDQGGIISLGSVTGSGTNPLITAAFIWEEIATGSE